jgi:homoserine O-acetyltransferase
VTTAPVSSDPAAAPSDPKSVQGERSVPRSPDRPTGTGRIEFATLGPFELEDGAVLPELTVAYRHDGPAPGTAPQALVIHALTGSADAAGDWWSPLIGPGKALDTTRIGVICTNLLGGCYGTTGPTSRDARTGAAYGASFPNVTTRDQARVMWRLLDALGFERLALVAGGSLGGMIVLEVGLERPNAVDVLLPIAAPPATGPMAIAWNHIQLRLIEALGNEGMALARQLAMTTYRSEADFDERFGRGTERDGTLSIVSYLEYQGRKLVDRFDRETYRVLVGAMNRHDITRGRAATVVETLAPLGAAGIRLLGLGINDDILYGPLQVQRLVDAAGAAGLNAEYRQLHSNKGHDAFLVEWPQMTEILRGLVP